MLAVDRRSMLTGGGALALAAALPRAARARDIVTRRSVTSPAADGVIQSYRVAVAAMKSLPLSDPRNWTRQAEIHRDHCPHGNWYFLPWHRAYLCAFERICQQLSGDANFALPYWDWSVDRAFPKAFLEKTFIAPGQSSPQDNPLFDPERNDAVNYVSLPDDMVGPAVIAEILAQSDFESFGSTRPLNPTQDSTDASWLTKSGLHGQLEHNAHNRVHRGVGGASPPKGHMATHMSPLDPIFWLHHSNVDRIWEQWNRLGRVNSADPLWRNFSFSGYFFVPSGVATTRFDPKVSDLFDVRALGYRYPVTSMRLPGMLSKTRIDFANLPPLAAIEVAIAARLHARTDMSVTLEAHHIKRLARIRALVRRLLRGAGKSDIKVSSRIIAIIRDVTPPSDGNADVRVFINCDYLTPDTPTSDPHFVTTFSFFITEHAEHGRKVSFLIDLTDAVHRLTKAQRGPVDKINVQLMPVPVPGGPNDGVEFKPDRVEIAVF